MDDIKYKFMEGVLGPHGAGALKKAAERSKTFENALVPRTILAWLGVYARSDYEGDLPGLENTYLAFTKHENVYSGVISIGSQDYSFESAPLFHLASAIAVSLGVEDERVDPSLRALDLAHLGKSIDVLAKAQAVSRAREEELDEELEKGQELPGQAAAPKEATSALMPKAPETKDPRPPKPTVANLGQPKQPQMQPLAPIGPSVHAPATTAANQVAAPQKAIKLPKLPTVKLKRSEADHKCPVCDRAQFKDDALVGCLCFRGLSKAMKATKTNDQFVITFGADWDEEAISVFLESVGRK